MRIVPKFSGGGQSLFTVYQSLETPTVTPKTSKTSDSESESVTIKDSSKKTDEEDTDKEDTKGKLTTKDLMNMVKDVDGLPNEMKKVIMGLKSNLAIENLGFSDTGELATTYLNTLYKLKIANQNKKNFDESIKTTKENGALGEVAISLSGNLFAQDKDGNIHEVSLEQYTQNSGSYQLLTNANLAWLRKYSSKLAFDSTSNILETLDNSIGYESFQALLSKAQTSLGSYKYEESGTTGKQALLGLKALQGISDTEKKKILDSITEDTVSYSMSNDTNVQNVQALVQYLTAALPKRAKIWAAIKTGVADENKATQALVGQFLSGRIKSDSKFTVEPNKKSKDGDGSGNGGSSDLGKLPSNTPTKFLQGYGVKGSFTLSPGTSRSVQVLTSSLPLTDANGKPVGAQATLLSAVNGEYNGILDFNHATIAGHTINSAAFGNIILQDGKIASVDYPCTIKPNGDIVPNTSKEIINAKKEAEKLLRSKGVDVQKPEHLKKYYKAINAAYQKYGLEAAYNDQGQPIGTWRRFGVVNVTASDKALGLGDMDDNPLLHEITDDTTINNLIQITKDENFEKKGFFNSITGNYNRFYEGTLWIPIDVNYQAAASSSLTMAQSQTLEQAQQGLEARQNWNTPHEI